MQGPASPGACRGISGRSLTTAGPPSLGTRTRLPLPASPLAHLGLAELTAGISPPQEPSSILLKMDVTRELKTPHCGLSQLLGFPDTSPQPFRQTLKDWAEKQLKPQCSLVSPPLSLSLGTLLSCPLREGRGGILRRSPLPQFQRGNSHYYLLRINRTTAAACRRCRLKLYLAAGRGWRRPEFPRPGPSLLRCPALPSAGSAAGTGEPFKSLNSPRKRFQVK